LSEQRARASVSWTIMELVPGSYSYLARAQDSVGQWSNTSEHQISILASNTVRDLRIAEYTIPTTMAPGATVPMSTVIENQGSRRETANLTVTINTTILYQEAIPLNPGETTTVSWQWTAIDSETTATLHVIIEPLPGETETDDNDVIIILQIGDTSPWLIPVVALVTVSGIAALLWYRSRK
jgi:hypothetical protein